MTKLVIVKYLPLVVGTVAKNLNYGVIKVYDSFGIYCGAKFWHKFDLKHQIFTQVLIVDKEEPNETAD